MPWVLVAPYRIFLPYYIFRITMTSGGVLSRMHLEDCHQGCSWNTRRKPSQLEGTTGDASQLEGLHLLEATQVSWKDSLGGSQSAGRTSMGHQKTTITWKADTWDARGNFSSAGRLTLRTIEGTPASWKDSSGRQKRLQSADELDLG